MTPATMSREAQEEAEEVSLDMLYAEEETSMATTLSCESAVASTMYSPISTWPWAGGGQLSPTIYKPYDLQSSRPPNTAWPCSTPQFSRWGMPYPEFTLPANPV